MPIHVTVKLKVKEPAREVPLNLPEGATALDALCEAADVETRGIPGTGAFVVAVDGVRKKIKYTVSGQKYDWSMSRHPLKEGDVLEVFPKEEH